MIEIFQRFCDAEFATDWAWLRERFGDNAPHGLLPRSDAQRRFDALLAIFEAAAAIYPGYHLYRANSPVHIPIVVLEPIGPGLPDPRGASRPVRRP